MNIAADIRFLDFVRAHHPGVQRTATLRMRQQKAGSHKKKTTQCVPEGPNSAKNNPTANLTKLC